MKFKLTFLILMCGVTAIAQVKTIGQPKLYFGVAYYPELWDEKEVDSAIDRMKELHINVVRMGEFAWSKMEPQEGIYDFGWLHKIINKLHENDIDVVLGTPTATPPQWMWTRYPTIGRVNENKLLLGGGGRRDTKYTSKIYNQQCQAIAKKMAQEFGNKPGVIAWQIDNEFKLVYDYSAETKELWQQWLALKYKNIQNLNTAWGTILWSQNYNAFEDVPMPTNLVWHNPSLKFDWAIFTNQQVYNFEQLQVKAIKQYSKLPITHDAMPGQPVDYEKLGTLEDFSAINIYHNYKVYNRILNNYDRLRALGKGMYWLFETSPNYAGGGENGITWFTHEPENSMKAFMWSNYALGGQGAMFWLWKQQWAGQEMTHGSVMSAWNKPAANYAAIKQLGNEINLSSSFLTKNPVVPAKIAIVYSHSSDIGFDIENYVDGLKYYQDFSARFYQPLQESQLHRDVIYPSHSLDAYKVLVVPMVPLLNQEFKDRLEKWVKNGGTLILGPMTGYRTENWTSFRNAATGDLENWTGVTIESRIPAPLNKSNNQLDVTLNWNKHFDIAEDAITLWADALSTQTGSVLATYANGMQKGLPAIIENRVGAGKVIILGTNPGTAAIKALYLHYASEQKITPDAHGAATILVAYRGQAKSAIGGAVLINYRPIIQNISLSIEKNAKNLLSNQWVNTAAIKLEPYQVMVLKF